MADAAPSLEQRLDRLEKIVQSLEREDLELEQAMQLFEEGVTHIRHAQELLNQAELRIERLIGGSPRA
jgi:exodeoxyribonuclease VII small subunit